MSTVEIDSFLSTHMKKGSRFVPARLQAALALLERLRTNPGLDLGLHMTEEGQSGLESHESYGAAAHLRFGIDAINRTHGRRSSNIHSWGQPLLDLLQEFGFNAATEEEKSSMLTLFQESVVRGLREILEQGPLVANFRGRTAEFMIGELLDQAEVKGKTGDVAQYLVGAKLSMRFQREIPIHPANKGDRKALGDPNARLGDFEIENAVIEVAVGLPDDKHLQQVEMIAGRSELEVWLLTRLDRVEIWRGEVAKFIGADCKRVVVASVESFVGQNITEMGTFSSKGKVATMRQLFSIYNERWIKTLGAAGIRIECP